LCACPAALTPRRLLFLAPLPAHLAKEGGSGIEATFASLNIKFYVCPGYKVFFLPTLGVAYHRPHCRSGRGRFHYPPPTNL
jgi:hypothetical protein